MPVGQTLDKTIIQAKDMKGVQSNGVILSRRELGLSAESDTDADDTNILIKSVETTKLDNNSPNKQKTAKQDKKSAKSDNKTSKQQQVELNDTIYTLPHNTPVGIELTELGRISNTDCPSNLRCASAKSLVAYKPLPLDFNNKQNPSLYCVKSAPIAPFDIVNLPC